MNLVEKAKNILLNPKRELSGNILKKFKICK